MVWEDEVGREAEKASVAGCGINFDVLGRMPELKVSMNKGESQAGMRVCYPNFSAWATW